MRSSQNAASFPQTSSGQCSFDISGPARRPSCDPLIAVPCSADALEAQNCRRKILDCHAHGFGKSDLIGIAAAGVTA